MYCPKCGQEVGEYTRICPACGELLENTPAQQPQQDLNHSQQPQPDYHNNQPQPNYSNPQQPSNNHYQQNPAIPDYKVQSILLIVFSSVLCCFGCLSILALPFAIVALVNSNKIAQHVNAGNMDLAMETSKKTKMWCWISFGVLIFSLILIAVSYIVLLSSGEYWDMMEQFMEEFQYQYDY